MDDQPEKKAMDPRIEYICTFVTKTMRIKMDKLSKMISLEENKVCMDVAHMI